MSSRLYELKARIKADASVALEVRDLYTVNGKDYEGEPRPLTKDDADTVAFLAGFNSAAVAERDAKIAELAQARTDHAAAMAAKEAEHAAALSTLNTEHAEALQAKADEIAALNTAHAEALAAKAEEIAGLQSDLSTANTDKAAAVSAKDAAEAALATAQARIAELEAELEELKNPPVNPRVLYPSEFIAKFSLPELLGIFRGVSSENDQVAGVAMQAVAQMFTVTRVELDSPLLVQLLDGLTATGLIAPGRAAEIRE